MSGKEHPPDFRVHPFVLDLSGSPLRLRLVRINFSTRRGRARPFATTGEETTLALGNVRIVRELRCMTSVTVAVLRRPDLPKDDILGRLLSAFAFLLLRGGWRGTGCVIEDDF